MGRVQGRGVPQGGTKTKVKNFFLHKQSPKIRKEEGMSETKKLRKKTPESSNSCPIPRRIDPPKYSGGKKINKQRTQGAKVLRSPESRLKE